MHDKKERNRESAKLCRMRKRLYIDMLEEKVSRLTAEVQDLRKRLEDTPTQLKSSSSYRSILECIFNCSGCFEDPRSSDKNKQAIFRMGRDLETRIKGMIDLTLNELKMLGINHE